MANKRIDELTLLDKASITPASDVLAMVDVSDSNNTKKVTIESAVQSTLRDAGAANGVLYLNGSKVATSGSALMFDGVNFKINTTGVFQVGNTVVTDRLNVSPNAPGSGATIYSTNFAGTYYSLLYFDASQFVFRPNSTEAMRLDSNGNLGLGVTPSAWTSAGHIDLPASTGVYSQGNGIDVGSNWYYNGINFSYKTSSYATWYNQNSGIHKWFTAPSGTAGSTISFTQAMTLDASGNLGIGTSSPSTKLHVQLPNTAAQGSVREILLRADSDGANNSLNSLVGVTFSNRWEGHAYIAGSFAQTSGIYGINTDNSTFGRSMGLTFYTSPLDGTATEKMRLDSSGNLGLGVTPSAWSGINAAMQLADYGTVASKGLNLWLGTNFYYGSGDKYVQTGAATRYAQESGAHKWLTAPPGTAGNAISFTQAMTLDASGNLLVGTTTVNGNGWTISPAGTGQIRSTGTGSADKIQFANGNGVVGAITTNGTATSYNTSSDYRLKNITGPVQNSGAYIDSLNPVEGTWKADGSTFVGLIAHEVQEVSRTQVATGEKDGAEMQAMDYSNSELIANLIAEVQELRKRVAQLENR